ncbi:threonine-phosphate decarboxylase CobD [Pseudomonadota bacterium]|nr:threonine-phosphate decarboxylase CobD [Pseudomonadota bacterium]
MLEHGGNLNSAAKHYNIPLNEWLDLSTGINPNGWLVPPSLPAVLWTQLPQDDDGLIAAAQDYYKCESLLAVAGSQAAIQTLPKCRPHSRVGLLSPAYAEHAHAWQQAGHEVITLDAEQITASLSGLDVLIIINPNNPTGQRFSALQLLKWHETLSAHGGWLIVDEAFIDVTPELSLSHLCPKNGLIVLRSIGKFFGLAGLRTGFVLASKELLLILKEQLGPWPIAAMSRYITSQALTDKQWQQQNRQLLISQGEKLTQLLHKVGLSPQGSCSLFQWVQTDQAEYLHQKLAKMGILTRLFSQPASLRFGLPQSDHDWQRLQSALSTLAISRTE